MFRIIFSYFSYRRKIWLLVLFMALGLAVISYVLFYPFKTIEFKNSPFPVISPQPLKANDMLRYEAEFCNYTQAQGKLTRVIYDSTTKQSVIVIALNQPFKINVIGCQTLVPTNTFIPTTLTTGNYYVGFEICYTFLWRETKCTYAKTQNFNVVKDDKQ